MVWLNGIDTSAHLGSYMEKGRTIAVLGNGFNNIFPKENIRLYNKILENDGLIISEYSPETKCKSSFFLERNRIISGLSLGILVVEAGYRSGTSVTAKLAKKQSRKVFALPHEIDDLHGVGTNRLIREGAILTTCVSDILYEFEELKGLLDSNIINRFCDSSFLDIFDNSKYQNDRKLSLISDLTSQTRENQKKQLKDPKFKSVYSLINDSPVSINTICKKTSKTVSEISNVLFMLELDGYIKKVAGGYICINN